MATPIPITARVHYDDVQKEYRLVASREDPKGGAPFDVNEVARVVEEFLTLLELVAFLVDFMSGIGPTAGLGPTTPEMGDWDQFATWAKMRAGMV